MGRGHCELQRFAGMEQGARLCQDDRLVCAAAGRRFKIGFSLRAISNSARECPWQSRALEGKAEPVRLGRKPTIVKRIRNHDLSNLWSGSMRRGSIGLIFAALAALAAAPPLSDAAESCWQPGLTRNIGIAEPGCDSVASADAPKETPTRPADQPPSNGHSKAPGHAKHHKPSTSDR